MNIKTINKFLAICILVGLSLMITGFAMGGAKYSIYMDLSGVHVVNTEGGSKAQIYENDLGKLTSIDISANLADVEFVSSDKYGLEINYSEKYGTPEWSVKDGTLKINDNSDYRYAFKFINIDIGALGFWDSKNYIRVYLPKGETLETVTVLTKCGDITLGGFTADNIKITNSLGNCKLDKVTSGMLSTALSSGNFELKNSAVSELDIKNNLGDIVINGSTLNNSEINNDCGDVRLSSDFTGRTNIDSSLGDINVNLAKAKDYYSINLSTSLGNIKIDNDRMGNNATIMESGSENLLKIKNDCGDIEVNFNR